MVQSISNQDSSPFGTINKIETAQNGRVVYAVTNQNGQESGRISIAPKDCDTFEKSYRDIIESAPKIQKYTETNLSPEGLKKKKNISRCIIGGCAVLGAAVPIYLTRKASTVKQVLATAAGIVAGLSGGFGLTLALITPPGSRKFTKALKNISKLDIQQIE